MLLLLLHFLVSGNSDKPSPPAKRQEGFRSVGMPSGLEWVHRGLQREGHDQTYIVGLLALSFLLPIGLAMR